MHLEIQLSMRQVYVIVLPKYQTHYLHIVSMIVKKVSFGYLGLKNDDVHFSSKASVSV